MQNNMKMLDDCVFLNPGFLYPDTIVFRVAECISLSSQFQKAIMAAREKCNSITVEPKLSRRHPLLPAVRITIQRPQKNVLNELEWMLNGIGYLMTRVDYAYDIYVYDVIAGTEAVKQYIVKRWCTKEMPNHYKNTKYIRAKHHGRQNIAVYGDKISKVFNATCPHIDFRFYGCAVRDGLKILRLPDIYDHLNRDFLNHHLMWKTVDLKQLGKYALHQQMQKKPFANLTPSWPFDFNDWEYIGRQYLRMLKNYIVPGMRIEQYIERASKYPRSKQKLITRHKRHLLQSDPVGSQEILVALADRYRKYGSMNPERIMKEISIFEVLGDNIVPMEVLPVELKRDFSGV